jgi:hypothetical protein
MIAATEAHFAGNGKWLLARAAETIIFVDQRQSHGQGPGGMFG